MSQGLGGGLLGGALIADAIGDHEQHEQMEQQQAYDQGCEYNGIMNTQIDCTDSL